jgi:hypothetical protein
MSCRGKNLPYFPTICYDPSFVLISIVLNSMNFDGFGPYVDAIRAPS